MTCACAWFQLHWVMQSCSQSHHRGELQKHATLVLSHQYGDDDDDDGLTISYETRGHSLGETRRADGMPLVQTVFDQELSPVTFFDGLFLLREFVESVSDHR